jgi:hypothetical protein
LDSPVVALEAIALLLLFALIMHWVGYDILSETRFGRDHQEQQPRGAELAWTAHVQEGHLGELL